MEVGKDTTKLASRLLIGELHDTQTGGSDEHLAIGALKETGSIAVALLPLMVEEGDVMKLFAVPRL